MTKKQLIEKLKSLPGDDNMTVMLMQTDDESPYNMVQTVEVKSLTFGAPDVPKKQWSKEKCVVITDED